LRQLSAEGKHTPDTACSAQPSWRRKIFHAGGNRRGGI
jgi:hypothetical protein